MKAHRFSTSGVLALAVCCLATSAQAVQWPIWDNDTSEPHVVFGEPNYIAHDGEHHVVHKYGAFTVYWDDQVLAPRWTAIKLTYRMADEHGEIDRLKKFNIDQTLKQKGYEVTEHDDYKNPTGVRRWDRGHMVQFDDARGYGEQAAKDSFYTSNICPQLSALNQRGWLTLEETCTEFARDYQVAWVYTGPIYGEHKQPFVPGRTPVIMRPIAFYKIVVEPGEKDGVDVLDLSMPHEQIPRDVDVYEYLVSIDDIEDATGIDFLQAIPNDYENMLESIVWDLWPDLPNEDEQ